MSEREYQLNRAISRKERQLKAVHKCFFRVKIRKNTVIFSNIEKNIVVYMRRPA